VAPNRRLGGRLLSRGCGEPDSERVRSGLRAVDDCPASVARAGFHPARGRAQDPARAPSKIGARFQSPLGACRGAAGRRPSRRDRGGP